MNLFSLEFVILLFTTFVLYYIVFAINKLAKRTMIPQWLVLLIASLIFYGFTNYVYLIYLAVSFSVSYFAALLCQYKMFHRFRFGNACEYVLSPARLENHSSRKRYENFVTAISIIVNVCILAVLKYFNFFTDNVNSIFHLGLNTYKFIVPVGLSFYTFSLIAYNVDCCKRITKAETNPFKFLLFVSYFPKILQGPISSYDKLKEDGLFSGHSFKDVNYLKSFFRISIGLIKKIVIANTLNLYVNASYANLNNSYGGDLFITSLLYTIQLYCDFSGFADITIGISGLFGIKLEENFNIPYISKSISEFWRRWHITLGAWLKKYIYIPLGGNKVSVIRWIINILIVWFVSGIWHGANWTFIIWGLFFGTLIVIGGIANQIKKRKGVVSKKHPICPQLSLISMFVTFLLVNLGWIMFRSDDITQAGQFFWHMIQFWRSDYTVFLDSTISKANWLFVISICFIFLLTVVRILLLFKDTLLLQAKHRDLVIKSTTFITIVLFFTVSIFTFIYLNSIGGGESSFIYFDF